MKKQLIDLMIEAGVKWPKGAEYAAQDKNSNDLCFYRTEPKHSESWTEEWRPSEPQGIVGKRVNLPSLCTKWRSTLVTREQYEKALAARRPAHFPTRPPETFMCRCVAAPVSRTIEQRIASLRALEKRVEETRAELTRDLEALGLTWMVHDEPTITDWRDLRVGDVIMIDYVNGDHIGGDRKLALEGRESIIVSDGDLYPVCVTNDSYPKGHSLNMKGAVENGCRWHFIRRP